LLREWINSALILPKGPWVDGSYWTLPVEVSFYTVVFLLLAFNLKRYIPVVVGTIGLLSATTWIALTAINESGLLGHFNHLVHWTSRWIYILSTREDVLLTLLPHGCFFAEGAFLWLCLFKGATRFRVAVLVACAIGGTAETLNHANLGLMATFGNTHPGWPYYPLIPCLAWLLSVIALCLSVVKNQWFSDLIGERAGWLRQVGLLTYPLYLLHQTIGFIMISGLRSHLSDNASLLITCIAIMALAYCVAKFVEPPLKSAVLRLIREDSKMPGFSSKSTQAVSKTTTA